MFGRHLLVAATLCLPTTATALTGGGDAGNDADGLALNAAQPSNSRVVALQFAGANLTDDAATSLLGRYGLMPQDVLSALAPELGACALRLTSTEAADAVVHEYYELTYGGYPLANAVLQLHHQANRLVMLRSELPSLRLPSMPYTADDFQSLASLGYDLTVKQLASARQVIAEDHGFAAPAWEFFRPAPGGSEYLLIHAQTGTVLQRRTTIFDLAEVYAKGPADGQTVQVDLPDLNGNGVLDGQHFSVFAPTPSDSRASAGETGFIFNPGDAAEALSFDQVEAYYGATRALAWFKTNLGYDIGAAHIIVRTNDLVDGRPDNAMYVAPPEGPEIQIGKGNGILQNLARDTDVVSHEFTHHVVYAHVTSTDGESGIFHEGTADYFAYAINGDPCLGESIVVGGGCLRTAALPDAMRFDATPSTKGKHYLGQFWSAVLWDIRQQLQADGDRLVYSSLAYLGASSGFRDAFLGLLNADRDLNPLPVGSAGAGVYGRNKCMILGAGIHRGFGAYLGEFDGLSCGLNLAQEAQSSRDIASGQDTSGGGRKGVTLSLFGRTCATVGGGRQSGQLLWVWLLLTLPMLVGALAHRRGASEANDGP